MAKKLLIDAAHPEETRVAAVDDGKVVGFEFESSAKQQIVGNIYLARVVRIEAALQAVFVEYGGNRHGFLAFQEIHPDYYNIPVEDRQEDAGPLDDASQDAVSRNAASETIDLRIGDDGQGPIGEDSGLGTQPSGGDAPDSGTGELDGVAAAADSPETDSDGSPAGSDAQKQRRKYRVQEVIRKSQILLVQVTKDERGGKGAALTTYISLAGRYCVLMPNSDRGGGISRKITNLSDRRKLKKIVADIAVPQEAGLIIRTAGVSRTKQEIRRDYDFLVRQWNEIRELTLKSIAPAKIYEEGNLIRRAIRDDYAKDMEEILVQGEHGYKTAKNFMKMIMPSHAKKVKQHSEEQPIFACHGIEREVGGLLDPVVHLKSGGYIVIDRTEALTAVDVNSGRATRQGTLEKTALQTNLEAAEAIAAQLKLRDLAGLIVIDFIDMEEQKNNLAVERRMKESVKSDRSRIQLGHISGFGLLEMSRQRLKPGFLEIATNDCPQCGGSGRVRAENSFAIDVLRRIESEAASEQGHDTVHATVPQRIADFLLNRKRQDILDIEKHHGVAVIVSGSDSLPDQNLEIRKVKQNVSDSGEEQEHVIGVDTPFQTAVPDRGSSDKRSDGQKRRRRRGARGSGQKQKPNPQQDAAAAEQPGDQNSRDPADSDSGKGEKKKSPRKSNRRQRRPQSEDASSAAPQTESSQQGPSDAPASGKSRSRSSRRRRRKPGQAAAAPESGQSAPDHPAAESAPAADGASPPAVTGNRSSVEAAAEKPKEQKAKSVRRRKPRSTASQEPAKPETAEPEK